MIVFLKMYYRLILGQPKRRFLAIFGLYLGAHGVKMVVNVISAILNLQKDKNCPKWPKYGYFWPRRPKIHPQGHFWSKIGQNGHFWKFLGYFGSYFAIFSRIWTKFGGISPNTAYFGQKSLKKALFGLFLTVFGHFWSKLTKNVQKQSKIAQKVLF